MTATTMPTISKAGHTNDHTNLASSAASKSPYSVGRRMASPLFEKAIIGLIRARRSLAPNAYRSPLYGFFPDRSVCFQYRGIEF